MVDPPSWSSRACIRCGACVGSCPTGALTLRNWAIITDDLLCTRCGRCVLICPTGCFKEGSSLE